VMRRLRAALMRVRGLFGQRRLERELADELESHLQLHIDENLRAGMAPAEARRRAIIALGGVEQAKEQYRDRRGVPCVTHLVQDTRYGLRTLRRNPGFAAAAIVTLALGLGANMAIFRFVDAVVLESLPVPNPEDLVVVRPFAFSYPSFRQLTAVTTDVFAGTAVRSPIRVDLSADGLTEHLPAELVSGSYFGMLGVEPALGRVLDPHDDEAEGAARVCVISYNLWQRRFEGDPAVVGRIIRLNAEPFEIVGVSERGFRGADLHARHEVQIPMSMTRLFAGMVRDSPGSTWLLVMARLAPGVTREQAEAGVRAKFDPPFEWQKQQPLSLASGRQGIGSLRSQLEHPVLIAQLLSGCVLLIACANLASLLLAKTSARRRELAVRQSLGASRGRIVSQLLVESSLLACAGATAGAGVAIVLNRLLTAMLASPGWNVDLTAVPSALGIGVSVGVMIVAALSIGLLPALVATREAPLDGLREAPLSGRPRYLGRALVVAQVVVCLVLVFAAGLFARSLHNLRSVDLGLDPQQVAVLTTNPERSGYSRDRSMEFYAEWLRRARLVPGVSNASLASVVAMSQAMFAGTVDVPDAEPREGPTPNNNINVVTPDYFRTVGLPIVAGRSFTGTDGPNAPPVVIVNERFAEYYWPGRSPIGRQFTIFSKTTVEIVGLVRTAKYRTVREEPQITIYLPLAQRPRSELTLHARIAGSTRAAAAALLRAAHAIDPNVPVYDVAALEDHVNARLSNERVLNVLSILFASLALFVACAGLYGLVSYAVVRRRREIGIRLAVGAQRHDVLGLFLRDVVALVAIGMALGMPLAFAAGRQFSSVLYGLDATSVSTLLLAASLLGTVAILAAAIPSARAMRVDPIATLREQ
ncbi:MAG TPA: ABC transporter permease, partial [Gemmatimonadaceae bacterium]|nr:ABC transporter permease [Gemmatimonadaceae bacterium]